MAVERKAVFPRKQGSIYPGVSVPLVPGIQSVLSKDLFNDCDLSSRSAKPLAFSEPQFPILQTGN